MLVYRSFHPASRMHVSYQAVIEVTKANSDFLWNANAMEGLYCAVVLLAFVQADFTVSKTLLIDVERFIHNQ